MSGGENQSEKLIEVKLNAATEHRAPEEETRRYVEIAEHFWVIVKKEYHSFSALVLWCSVTLRYEISGQQKNFVS